MLILTRRESEAVVIGRNITISVIGVKGNQVRLGISAPGDVPVHRKEIAERIQREKSASDTRDRAAPAEPAAGHPL